MNLHDLASGPTDAFKLETALRTFNRYDVEVRVRPDGNFEHRERNGGTTWYELHKSSAQYWIDRYNDTWPAKR